jgi:GNAT superfamily N-acetyltransferase
MNTLVTPDVEITTISCSKGIEQACELLLKERMYVEGWSFQRWYKEPYEIKRILIARVNGKIVGCGVLRRFDERPDNGTYVHPNFRRQGIGTKIFEQMSKERELKPATSWPYTEFFFHCKNIGIQVNYP